VRIYLAIGFATLLGVCVFGWTSTDGWMRKLGRNWKRLHRIIFGLGAFAIVHFFMQARANVSEAVLMSGRFIWLILWRALPSARQPHFLTSLGLVPACVIGSALEQEAVAGARAKSAGPTKAIALSIDGGHARAARQYQGRSFEVLLAQVSNDGGKRVVFSTVPAEANSQTRQLPGVLRGLGATPATPVTILSDGADGPRSLGEAASPGPTHHVLDWFRLAMRVQHVAQAAMSWPDTTETDRQAGNRLAETIEQIRWRLWHGQVKRALDLIAETVVTVDATADHTEPITAAGRKWRAFLAIWRHTCPDNRISLSITRQLDGLKNRSRRRSPRARCNGCCIGE
jgi:hypothetical protein